MQFRLLASSTATNLNRIFFSSPPNITSTTTIPSLSPTLINFTTADPALYSDSTQHEEAASSTTEQKPTKENDPFVSTKPPVSIFPKLESTGRVNKPMQPIT